MSVHVPSFPLWVITNAKIVDAEGNLTTLSGLLDPLGNSVAMVFTNEELAERFVGKLFGPEHKPVKIETASQLLEMVNEVSSEGITHVEVNPTTDAGTSGDRFALADFAGFLAMLL